MSELKPCPSCSYRLPTNSRFCPKCGTRVDAQVKESPGAESLNLRILYIMVGLLILGVLFPPWETPPGDPPAFLGFHFILSPPISGAIVSRMLQTIQLVTIAVAGLYLSWLFRTPSR